MISTEFKQCEIYKTELQYMERFVDILPYSVKKPIVLMSDMNIVLKEYNVRSKDCTEEEKEVLVKELNAYAESKRSDLETMQYETERNIQLLFGFAYSMLFYIILWNWKEIVIMYNGIKCMIKSGIGFLSR